MSDVQDCRPKKGVHESGVCGGIYGFAVLGAAVYFIQHSTSFWGGVWGVLKAIAWPAVLIYKLLEYLKL